MFEGTGAVDGAEDLYTVRSPKSDHNLGRVWFGRVHRKTGYTGYLVVEGFLPCWKIVVINGTTGEDGHSLSHLQVPVFIQTEGRYDSTFKGNNNLAGIYRRSHYSLVLPSGCFLEDK